ncbi:MAG: cytochrome c maturation protein CcmE [bacterium]|nr:cytochrome c maturation protein CcmE [bacterium]
MSAKKIKFGVGFVVIAACLLYLVFSSSRQMSMYFFTVTELEARETEFRGQRIKLAGKVVPGSIEKNNRVLQFQIWEPLNDEKGTFSGKRAIRYQGIVPDTFRDEADVVLEGITLANGIFQADDLLAKCPSKYEGKSYEDVKKDYGQTSY